MNFTIKSIRNYYPHLTIIAVLLFINIVMSSQKPAPVQLVKEHKHLVPQPNPEMQDFEDHRATQYYEMDALELGKDYQLEVAETGVEVWDGKRYVGFLPYRGNEKCLLHQLINKDNE